MYVDRQLVVDPCVERWETQGAAMLITSALIDDLSCELPLTVIGTSWQLFTDQVMGGVSNGTMVREIIDGRPAIRMRGDVSLENNGGFIQISVDLAPEGDVADVSGWQGIELDVLGRDEEYSLRLRTSELTRPWQSYRQSFIATPKWQTVKLRFDRFEPHRTEIPLNLQSLRRLGLVAIGRAFSADLALSGLRLFG